MTAELDWTRIVDELHTERGVSTGRMFSAEGLRLGDKYFAMLCRGELVVKLPAPRVDELEAGGVGRRFEPGPGRRMREWLTVPVARRRRWRPLATEALDFARSHYTTAAAEIPGSSAPTAAGRGR
jgi:hypothetical protein